VIPVPAAEPLGPWTGDRAGVPMHVTLLYPFAPPFLIDEALLSDLFGGFEPFDYRLGALRSFDDGTVYLAPEPAEPFVRLTWAVRRRWPEYPPYGGDLRDPVPHVTVPPGHADRERIETLLPLEGRADEAWLLERGPVRWATRTRFRFSG
jgi:2'-5' RNA ligase superfamily